MKSVVILIGLFATSLGAFGATDIKINCSSRFQDMKLAISAVINSKRELLSIELFRLDENHERLDLIEKVDGPIRGAVTRIDGYSVLLFGLPLKSKDFQSDEVSLVLPDSFKVIKRGVNRRIGFGAQLVRFDEEAGGMVSLNMNLNCQAEKYSHTDVNPCAKKLSH